VWWTCSWAKLHQGSRSTLQPPTSNLQPDPSFIHPSIYLSSANSPAHHIYTRKHRRSRRSRDKDATMALTVRPLPSPKSIPSSATNLTPPPPTQWRSFDFFDATQIKIPESNDAQARGPSSEPSLRSLFETNEVSAVCSGSDSLFLGGYDGIVRIVGPSWKVVRSFPAYEASSSGPAAASKGADGGDAVAITHMRQVEGTSLLVTVAVG
jgi:hypothetical protein